MSISVLPESGDAVIEVSGALRVTCDHTRSYFPREIEYVYPSIRTRNRYVAKKIEEINGVYVCTEGDLVVDYILSGETDWRTHSITHLQVTAGETNVPLPDTAFALQFPPGTIVHDEIAGEIYTVE